MRPQKLLLLTLIISSLLSVKILGQCPKIPGTIQLSDTFSIKATEITVYDYTSFIVSNGYDTTLFPEAEFLKDASYEELFTDLRNRTHERFLKAKGKGSYAFYYKNVKGNKSEKRKLKAWLDLPIGGISHLQAELFCKWLENYYNQFVDRHSRPCFYEIRLSSKTELEAALKAKGPIISSEVSGQTNYRFVVFIRRR